MYSVHNYLVGTRVLAPYGAIKYKAVVVNPPADHPTSADMVCVRFDPALEDPYFRSSVETNGTTGQSFTFLSCTTDVLELDQFGPSR